MTEEDLLIQGIAALLGLAATGKGLPMVMSYLHGMEVEFHFAPEGNYVAVRLKGSDKVIAVRTDIVTKEPYHFIKLPGMPIPIED